jgi:hypothetical protein
LWKLGSGKEIHISWPKDLPKTIKQLANGLFLEEKSTCNWKAIS